MELKKKYSFKLEEYKNNINNNLIKIISIIIFFILITCIFFVGNNFQHKYILRTKYDDDIKYYNDILKLYIENKTKFYIKSRERYMKIRGKYYNDSNITTIQDKIIG